jgi:hypothetical protein
VDLQVQWWDAADSGNNSILGVENFWYIINTRNSFLIYYNAKIIWI